ncbi:hypothetical protein [Comamonas thiooxydans]|uniref:hypothetical protein n=1 Tax=Comamonas thiooxydans TaxID=363952 RepID=UPI000B420EBA|nr:hypothetical protein [Comamonas thiooxydans]
MEAVMFYTHAVIRGLGALLGIIALLTAIQALAWRLYKDVVGWTTIAKAIKHYHASQRAQAQKGQA